MAKISTVSAKVVKSSGRSMPPAARSAKEAGGVKSGKPDKAEIRPVRNPRAKLPLSQAVRKDLVARLVALREEMTGQITALKNDALKRNDEVNPVEDGTDAYDRQFGLTLASSEQEAVAQINDALRRISESTYGICVQCQGLIEKARLDALPFVQTCIRCQSEVERNNSKFRPSASAAELEQWDENRTPSAEGEEEET